MTDSPFCKSLPQHRWAWDATSLQSLMRCPRKFYFEMIEGWRRREEAAPLQFGMAMHKGLEAYDHARMASEDHNAAQRKAILAALTIVRRVDAEGKFNGYALGSDPKRTHAALIRSIVWYTEQFKDDPFKTVRLSDGTSAVELSFRIALDALPPSPDGTPYFWCGHIDRVAENTGVPYVIERKHTARSLGSYYENQYNPNVQVTGYIFASQVLTQLPVRAAVIDVAALMAEGTRFQRFFSSRTATDLDDFLTNISGWFEFSRSCATRNYWPRNEGACTTFGLCPFYEVCSASSLMQQTILESNYVKHHWNPLEARLAD